MSTVIVLGAGATRGASFVEDSNMCLPPLQSDFYAQLQRIVEAKHKETIDRVVEFTTRTFGNNFRINFEEVFSTLEHMIEMLETTGENRAFKKADLKKARESLIQAIGAVLEESLTEKEKRKRKERACAYHEKLIQDLHHKSAIISFNYDCLIDSALRDHGNEKWNARYGYTFPLRGEGKLLEGWDSWGSSGRREKSIRLYKLHGSLHFKADRRGNISLKKTPYHKRNGKMIFEIIPPEAHKKLDEGMFSSLWQKAAAELYKAKAVVMIGYSFAQADLHSAALFRMGVRKGKISKLTIVNPDRDARYRTRAIFQKGLNDRSRVVVFDTFKEFSAANHELWRA